MTEPKDLTIIQLAALGAYQAFCPSHVCADCPLDEALEEGAPPEICPSYVIDHPHEVLRAFDVKPDCITDASWGVTGVRTDQIPAGDIIAMAKASPEAVAQAEAEPKADSQPQTKKPTPFICDIEDYGTALRQCERWEKDACYNRGYAKGLFAALWLAYKGQFPEKEG